MTILGVDIGGTGIKAAPVDVDAGRLTAPVKKRPTPRPALPETVAEVTAELIGDAAPSALGVGFPGVVREGVVGTAANLDRTWIGLDVASFLADRLACPTIAVMNDADAAGLAEVRFGAGADSSGVVVMVTLGTGIGSAVFNEGVLVPNSEYGHLVIDDVEAETLASGRARNSLTWEDWSEHLEVVLRAIERLIWPDLFIVGGGISAEFDRFCSNLDTATPVVAAAMGNDAGIIGAALASSDAPGNRFDCVEKEAPCASHPS